MSILIKHADVLLSNNPDLYAMRTHFVTMCGDCHIARELHPVQEDFAAGIIGCNREPDSIPSLYADSNDYLVDQYGNYVLPEDYSGNAANIEILIGDSREFEWDGIHTNTYDDSEAVERYVDRYPDEHTSATTWYYVTPEGEYHNGVYPLGHPKRNANTVDANVISPVMRNAYVENNDGFISLELLDEELTKKYHQRLLNWYLHKNGKVRIGSIELDSNYDGTITARCVNTNHCSYRTADGNYKTCSLTINLSNATRTEMEDFTYAIIRHGNNGAARWFTNKMVESTSVRTLTRSEFIEGTLTDTSVSLTVPKDTPAFYELQDLTNNGLPTEDEVVEFLFEHQKFCKTKACKCSDILASEVPALAKVAV